MGEEVTGVKREGYGRFKKKKEIERQKEEGYERRERHEQMEE